MLLLHHGTFSQLLLQRQFLISSLPALFLSVGLSCLSSHIFLFRAHCHGGRPAVNQPLPAPFAAAARRRSTQAEQNPVRRKRQIKMDRPIISLTVHGRTRAADLSSLQFNESRYTLRGKSTGKARRVSSPHGSLVVTTYVLFGIVLQRNYLTVRSTFVSSTLTSSRPVFLRVSLRQGLRRVQMGRPTCSGRARAESGITK